jgi:hypothetical protein
MSGFLPRNHFQDKSFTLSTRHSAEKVPSKNRTSFREFQIVHTIVYQINNHSNLFFLPKLIPKKTSNNSRLPRGDTQLTLNHQIIAYQTRDIFTIVLAVTIIYL